MPAFRRRRWERAADEGWLDFRHLDDYLPHQPGGRSDRNFAEFQAATGPRSSFLRPVYEVLGLPKPNPSAAIYVDQHVHMEDLGNAKRIVADGYDRMGAEFATWNSQRPRHARRSFLAEVLARLGEGSTVVELGCGPGTDAAELSVGRRYVGIDLSSVQLSIAQRRVPHATFVLGDLTSMAFRPGSVDGVVAMYVLMHVPQEELGPTFER